MSELKFLNVKVTDIEGFPIQKRLDGSYFPVENNLINDFDSEVAKEGVDLFGAAFEIHQLENAQSDDGTETPVVSFDQCLNTILNPTTNPELAGKYASNIKKVLDSKRDTDARKKYLVTIFLNCRVSQGWFKKHKKDIENGLLNLPYMDGDKLVKNTPLNSHDGKPTFNKEGDRLYWTLEMTYRLPENVIDTVFDYCITNDTKQKLENSQGDSEGDDFLQSSESSEKEQQE